GRSGRVASLAAGRGVHRTQALAAVTEPRVLVEGDAGKVLAGEVPEAELAAVELLDVGLVARLRETGEPHAGVEEPAGTGAADPVQDAAVVLAGLGPLSLVGESPLQAVVAAELVPVVPVQREERLARAREVVVEAHQLGVVVVAALVHRVGVVVEPLAGYVR